MWRSRLFRQFLLVSILIAVVVFSGNLFISAQLSGSEPDLDRIQLYRWIYTIIVLLLVFAGGAAYYVLVQRRVRSVLRGMAAVRQGSYPLVVAEGDDELAELARGFNQMVEALRSRDDRITRWVDKKENELVRLSQSLKEERDKLETVLDSIGEGVIVLDSENKVLMANRQVCDIFGIPPEAINGTGLDKLIEQVRHRLVDRAKIEKQIEDLRHDRQLVDEISIELDQPGSQAIRLYCAPVRGTDGTVLGRIATLLDMGREREMERLKAEFLSTISHELRTPLTSVKGALGLIRGGAAGAVHSDMAELLDIAMNNVERLIGLINNILDIFSLERGQAGMRLVPMSLAECAARAVANVSRDADRARVEIEAQVAPDMRPVRGDTRRVEQVLVNLLSNAIKFSHSHRPVTLSAWEDGAHAVIKVEDRGRGIAPDFMGKLFHKFEHSQSSLTRDTQGVGLGLAICRHIVEAHGGRIWAESKEGKGSTFFFTLPLDQRAMRPVTPVDMSRPGRCVLVIDDDEDVVRVISYVFESQGHRVLAARQGRQAVEMAREHHPDLLTLDLNMPEMDGWTVLSQLRSSEETRNIPIICISVTGDEDSVVSHGADYYLEKPVDIEKLRAIADRAFAGA